MVHSFRCSILKKIVFSEMGSPVVWQEGEYERFNSLDDLQN